MASALFTIEAILAQRIMSNGRSEYLIRWSGLGPHGDSWEPASVLLPRQSGTFFSSSIPKYTSQEGRLIHCLVDILVKFTGRVATYLTLAEEYIHRFGLALPLRNEELPRLIRQHFSRYIEITPAGLYCLNSSMSNLACEIMTRQELTVPDSPALILDRFQEILNSTPSSESLLQTVINLYSIRYSTHFGFTFSSSSHPFPFLFENSYHDLVRCPPNLTPDLLICSAPDRFRLYSFETRLFVGLVKMENNRKRPLTSEENTNSQQRDESKSNRPRQITLKRPKLQRDHTKKEEEEEAEAEAEAEEQKKKERPEKKKKQTSDSKSPIEKKVVIKQEDNKKICSREEPMKKTKLYAKRADSKASEQELVDLDCLLSRLRFLVQQKHKGIPPFTLLELSTDHFARSFAMSPERLVDLAKQFPNHFRVKDDGVSTIRLSTVRRTRNYLLGTINQDKTLRCILTVLKRHKIISLHHLLMEYEVSFGDVVRLVHSLLSTVSFFHSFACIVQI